MRGKMLVKKLFITCEMKSRRPTDGPFASRATEEGADPGYRIPQRGDGSHGSHNESSRGSISQHPHSLHRTLL